MPVKIFSGRATQYLAKKIAYDYGQTLGNIQHQVFSDGEMSPFILESVRGCDVFIIQSTFSPSDNFMELLLIIDAAKRASAKHVNVVIPYFGYARQDRKDRPRVSIAAKLVANLLSAAGASRVMTCDLHAEPIQGFFDIPVDHLDSNNIFLPYLQSLDHEHMIFATPDVGGIKRTRNFANFFNVDLVVCDKYRKESNHVKSMRLIGDVKGKDVVLTDDLVDTAGTLCKAAQLLKDKGARSIRAICTHPVLSGDAYATIENSVIEEVLVTDTIPLKKPSKKIKVLTVSGLFAKAIRKIYDNESISSLFLNKS